MDYLYHGSAVPGITALEARSTLHGTDKQIVYLTDSIPYALLYIWDGARSGSPVKHVTAWVEGGAARYEEQFPHQLERFYQGVSGWLYRAPKDAAQPVDGREGLFYVDGGTPVEGEYIPDVYGELLRHDAAGRAALHPANPGTAGGADGPCGPVDRPGGFFPGGRHPAGFYAGPLPRGVGPGPPQPFFRACHTLAKMSLSTKNASSSS